MDVGDLRFLGHFLIHLDGVPPEGEHEAVKAERPLEGVYNELYKEEVEEPGVILYSLFIFSGVFVLDGGKLNLVLALFLGNKHVSTHLRLPVVVALLSAGLDVIVADGLGSSMRPVVVVFLLELLFVKGSLFPV